MTPEQRFERIEANLDLVVDQIAILGSRVDGLAAAVEKTNSTVAQLADVVTSLVRLFENHTRDGHGGKGRKQS